MGKIVQKDYTIVKHPKGCIRKLWQIESLPYEPKEIYISEVIPGEFKGWKLHQRQISTLCVIHGTVEFSIKSDDEVANFTLSSECSTMLQIGTDTWFGFEAVGDVTAKILNFSSILHDPSEALIS